MKPLTIEELTKLEQSIATSGYDEWPTLDPQILLRLIEMAKLARALAEAAEGLSHGVDWNNGTHAKFYRPLLRKALASWNGGENKE